MDNNNNENNNQQNVTGSYNQPNINGNFNQPNVNYNPQGFVPNNPQGFNGNPPAEKNGKAIASLVLGIVGLVCIFFGYGALLGVICAIVGIILGTAAKKEDPNNGMAKTGVILSIVALALCVITFLACVACVGSLASSGAFDNYNY